MILDAQLTQLLPDRLGTRLGTIGMSRRVPCGCFILSAGEGILNLGESQDPSRDRHIRLLFSLEDWHYCSTLQPTVALLKSSSEAAGIPTPPFSTTLAAIEAHLPKNQPAFLLMSQPMCTNRESWVLFTWTPPTIELSPRLKLILARNRSEIVRSLPPAKEVSLEGKYLSTLSELSDALVLHLERTGSLADLRHFTGNSRMLSTTSSVPNDQPSVAIPTQGNVSLNSPSEMLRLGFIWRGILESGYSDPNSRLLSRLPLRLSMTCKDSLANFDFRRSGLRMSIVLDDTTSTVNAGSIASTPAETSSIGALLALFTSTLPTYYLFTWREKIGFALYIPKTAAPIMRFQYAMCKATALQLLETHTNKPICNVKDIRESDPTSVSAAYITEVTQQRPQEILELQGFRRAQQHKLPGDHFVVVELATQAPDANNPSVSYVAVGSTSRFPFVSTP